jgi:uncharacterized protein YdhG (YjbR/CyaY superfamily)
MVRDFNSIDDYIAAQPAAARTSLRRVGDTIRKAVPKAEESISYGMPTYKLHGERLLYFAGWKKHYSIYPATKALLTVFKGDLENIEIANSTLQFSFATPVPVKLIERIAKLRAKEVTKSSKARK